MDRTSLLVLADDWFGKWVEKFLKVCNKEPGSIGK